MQSKKQNVWGFPAAGNFFLGGIGAGLYVVIFCLESAGVNTAIMLSPVLLHILPSALVCTGFLVVALEAGRPARGPLMLLNPGSSWMSREVFAGIIFVVFSILNMVLRNEAFEYFTVSAAVLLLLSHGFVVYRARAVTAWNVPVLPLLFLASGCAGGAGLLLVIIALSNASISREVTFGCIAFLGLDLSAWTAYSWWNKDRHFRRATKVLRNKTVSLFIAGGNILTIMLLITILLNDMAAHTLKNQTTIAGLTGAMVLFINMCRMVLMVAGIGYFREMMLVRPDGSAYMPEQSS